MSRAKAKENPFFAVAIHNMQAGVRNIVREVRETWIRSGYDDVFWPGSGWREGSAEHRSGTAWDIIITANTGRRPTAKEREAALELIAWFIKNYKILGVEGILFSRDGKDRTEVWGYSTPGRGWRTLANRGNISANHIDHFHVKFKSGASWPTSLNGSVFGSGGTAVKLPDNTVTVTKSISQMVVEVIAGKHGNGHTNRQKSLGVNSTTYAAVRAEVNRRLGVTAKSMPNPVVVPQFPYGIRPNSSSPSAIQLQRQLKKAGFMPTSVRENANYGPQTQKAVAKFHNKYTQFRSRGSSYDPRIGPKGWKFLFERW